MSLQPAIAIFRAGFDRPFRAQIFFEEQSWREGIEFLRQEGVHLHLLQELNRLCLIDQLPPDTRAALEDRFSKNALRTENLITEFARINDTLRGAKIEFSNVLGFALVPASCPDANRLEIARFEILVLHSCAPEAEKSMRSAGYELTRTADHTRDFRHPASEVPIRFYLIPDSPQGEERVLPEMMKRSRYQMANGYLFRAPSASDQLIIQAVQIMGNLKQGKLRLASLLEFAYGIHFWRGAREFWKEVRERVAEHSIRPAAMGTALCLAAKIFGARVPSLLQEFLAAPDVHAIDAYIGYCGCDVLEVEIEETEASQCNTPARPAALTDDLERRLLRRICDAYIKATVDELKASEDFQPTEWWSGVRRKYLSAVCEALKARDLRTLSTLYANFFRNECGKGLVRRPLAPSGRNLQLSEEDIISLREDIWYRIQYWRDTTRAQFPISQLEGPGVGNPFGTRVDGVFIEAGSEYQHACAMRVSSLSPENAIVAEIGGGYACMARYLLLHRPDITYIDFDVPESLALAAYYLGMSMPDRKICLYGEHESSFDVPGEYAAVLLPPREMSRVPQKLVSVSFSSHTLCDLSPTSIPAYLKEISRFTRDGLVDAGREAHRGAFEKDFNLADLKQTFWNSYRAPGVVEWEALWVPRQ